MSLLPPPPAGLRSLQARFMLTVLLGAAVFSAVGDMLAYRLIAETLACGESLSVLCLDLDGFKPVNDQHGHAAGDEVLVACAQRMAASVRNARELVGRLGGDEFIIVLRGIGPADAALGQTAAAIVDALGQPCTLKDGKQISVGASIGIACLRRHGFGGPGLIEVADTALYEVKRSGKNSFAMGLPPAQAAAWQQPISSPAPGPASRAGSGQSDTRPASLV